MPSTIFSGSKVKTLKSTLNLNGGADIISSTTNPQSSAVSAEPGSLLLNTSSGTLYRKLDSGSTTNWAEVGAGTGGKNYIVNPDFDGGQTTGWAMKKVSLSSLIPTGNILTADAGHTIAVSSSSPLEGANSLLVQGASLFTAGNCLVSDAFAIDREDQAKVMGWSFSYEAVTTNMDFPGTSAGTWAVYIAEVTTATPDTVVSWIQPAGVYNLTQGSGVGLASGTFQTTASGTAYRLVLVCINSEAAATTLKVDDFQLGPQKVVYGSPVTDWQSYTPTFGGYSVQPSSVNFKYRRIGDSIQVTGYWELGTPSAAQFSISLPFGTSIDTSKIFSTAAIGNATRSSTSFQAATVIARTGISTTSVFCGGEYTAAQPGLTPQNGNTLFSATDGVSVEFFYPAAGLSSSVQMSNDTDTRVVAAKASYSTAAVVALTVADYTKVNLTLIEKDTHGTVNLTNDDWVCPVSGTYVVTAKVRASQSAGSQTIEVYAGKNASPGALFLGSATITTADSQLVFGARQIDLVAGDTISLQIYAPAANGRYDAFTTLELYRLSGPSVIAANETVAFLASGTAGDTIGTSESLIKFTSIEDSSHGAYSSSTGVFTAPVSGRYNATWAVITSGISLGTTQRMYSTIYKNGVSYKLGNRVIGSGGAGQQYMSIGTLNDIVLKAGDTLSIYAASDVATTATTATSINYFAVTKIGN